MHRKPNVHHLVQLGPSLTEQVTEMLREQITGGQYNEGESLPSEQNLSLEFGVSRAVIREAMSRLKADKLVIGRQGRGAIVASTIGSRSFRLSSETADDVEGIVKVTELRMGLEVEAAGLAAVRRQLKHLREMQNALNALSKAVTEGSVTRGVDADLRFHRAICDATDNAHYSAFFTFLAPFLKAALTVTRRNSMQRPSRIADVEAEHHAIYAAIHSGQINAARDAAREHVVNTLTRLRSLGDALESDGVLTQHPASTVVEKRNKRH